jgi:hypothetical protein
MNEEFDALLVNQSPSMNIVGSKWVFRIKWKVDESINKYKTRLVAKGFHQQSSIDYTETYSPVVKHITIQTVLTIALMENWNIH